MKKKAFITLTALFSCIYFYLKAMHPMLVTMHGTKSKRNIRQYAVVAADASEKAYHLSTAPVKATVTDDDPKPTEHITFGEPDKKDAAGFIEKREIDGVPTLIISFKGTDSVDDVITDVTGGIGIFKKEDKICGSGGKAHIGIYNKYLAIRQDMLNKLEQAKQLHKIDNYLITGHSLGGALATLAALDLKKHQPNKEIDLVTFSAPKVFNKAGADYTDKVLRDKSYRLYKEGDLVPLLGLTIIGFKHTGKALHFKSESKINPIKNHSIKEIKKDIVLGKAVHKNQKNPTEEMHKNIIDILKELFNNIKNAITKLFN